MSRLSQSQDQGLISSTAERYRRDGFEVIIQPGPSDLPFDLGSYSPDLIARKGNLAFIAEVRPQPEKVSFDQLRAISEEVKRHEGWEFVLITGQDDAFDIGGDSDDQISWEEASRRVQDAQRLSDLGQVEAAYLMLWIAFERLMRFQARRVALPVDRVAPAIMIRQLYSQGELSMAQFDTALSCQDVRNRIVHGFRAPELSDASTRLSALVHELLEQWPATVSA